MAFRILKIEDRSSLIIKLIAIFILVGAISCGVLAISIAAAFSNPHYLKHIPVAVISNFVILIIKTMLGLTAGLGLLRMKRYGLYLGVASMIFPILIRLTWLQSFSRLSPNQQQYLLTSIIISILLPILAIWYLIKNRQIFPKSRYMKNMFSSPLKIISVFLVFISIVGLAALPAYVNSILSTPTIGYLNTALTAIGVVLSLTAAYGLWHMKKYGYIVGLANSVLIIITRPLYMVYASVLLPGHLTQPGLFISVSISIIVHAFISYYLIKSQKQIRYR